MQRHLIHHGHNSVAVCGDLGVDAILQQWKKFCECEYRILISTDILSRGLGTENTCLVINFDEPNMNLYTKVYQYRATRTGRFGRSGAVVTLLNGAFARNTFVAEIQSIYGIHFDLL